MEHGRLTAAFIALLLGIVLSPARSQPIDDYPEVSVWATAGLGGGGGCGAGKLELSLRTDNIVFSFRRLTAEERPFLGWQSPREATEDLSFLVGMRFLDAEFFVGQASIGPALVTTRQRGRYLYSDGGLFGSHYYETISTTCFGISTEMQFHFTPASFLGVGLELSANVNPKRSWVGILLSAQVGLVN